MSGLTPPPPASPFPIVNAESKPNFMPGSKKRRDALLVYYVVIGTARGSRAMMRLQVKTKMASLLSSLSLYSFLMSCLYFRGLHGTEPGRHYAHHVDENDGTTFQFRF